MLKDMTSTVGYQFLTLVVGVAISAVTARALGPEGRGALAITSTTASLLALLALASGWLSALIADSFALDLLHSRENAVAFP